MTAEHRTKSRRQQLLTNAWAEYRVTRSLSTGNGEAFVAQEEDAPEWFMNGECGMGGPPRGCECGARHTCRLDSTMIGVEVAKVAEERRRRAETRANVSQHQKAAQARARTGRRRLSRDVLARGLALANAAIGKLDRDARARLLAETTRRRAVA